MRTIPYGRSHRRRRCCRRWFNFLLLTRLRNCPVGTARIQ